jgi:septal ring factor EnvC (AmiA/AmiB activator)
MREIADLTSTVRGREEELHARTAQIADYENDRADALKSLKKEQSKSRLLDQKLHDEDRAKESSIATIIGLRSFVAASLQPFRTARKFIVALFPKLNSVFSTFSLDPVEFDPTRMDSAFQLSSTAVVTLDLVEPATQTALDNLRSELAKFPLDERAVHDRSSGTLTDQLRAVTKTVAQIRAMLAERDRDVERLNGVIASQHDAVMKLTRATGIPFDPAHARHA